MSTDNMKSLLQLFESVEQGTKQQLTEGFMDTVKQAFNDCVVGYPQGTSEGQFIQGWARAIRAETGREIPLEKLTQLYHDYTERSEEIMKSHGTIDEDTYKDTSGTFKDRLVGEILNFYTTHGRIPKVSEYSRAVRSKLNSLDFDERSKLHRQANVQALKLAGKQGYFSKLGLDEDVTEGSEQQLNIQQLATISDEALDNAYHYGRSTPGNTFGWQANLKSAAYAKQMIDRGVTDIEAISDAIHKGWNVTARAFVQNPEQFADTEKLRAAGKLEAKLQQRAKLMNIGYSQLPDDEQEKDRVVARALLQALAQLKDMHDEYRQKGVAEGSDSQVVYKMSMSQYNAMSPEQKSAKQKELQLAKKKATQQLKGFTVVDSDKEQGVTEGMLTHRDFEKPDDADVLKMAKLAARGLLTYAAKTKMNPANLLKKDYYALAAMLEKINPNLYATIDGQLSDNDYNWLYFKAADLAAKSGVTEAAGMEEGSRKAYLKHNNLVDLEPAIGRLKDQFDKLLLTDPEEQQKHQQDVKQRLKTGMRDRLGSDDKSFDLAECKAFLNKRILKG
jgi:hypothetical protein